MYIVQEQRTRTAYRSLVKVGVIVMFMVVSFPWPVASAYAELTGYERASDRPGRPGRRRGEQAQPEHAQPELVGAGHSR